MNTLFLLLIVHSPSSIIDSLVVQNSSDVVQNSSDVVQPGSYAEKWKAKVVEFPEYFVVESRYGQKHGPIRLIFRGGA